MEIISWNGSQERNTFINFKDTSSEQNIFQQIDKALTND